MDVRAALLEGEPRRRRLRDVVHKSRGATGHLRRKTRSTTVAIGDGKLRLLIALRRHRRRCQLQSMLPDRSHPSAPHPGSPCSASRALTLPSLRWDAGNATIRREWTQHASIRLISRPASLHSQNQNTAGGRQLLSSRLSPPRLTASVQCDIRVGATVDSRMSRVAPPRMNSRSHE